MAETTAVTKRPMKRPVKASVWRPIFLEELAKSGNVAHSARVAGVDRVSAYKAREINEEFRAQWEEAEAEAVDSLQMEAWRRGRDGVEKPVFYKGEVVGYITEYSDNLLSFLLRAHRPEVFDRGTKLEVSGPDGGPIEYEVNEHAVSMAEQAYLEALRDGNAIESTARELPDGSPSVGG